MKQTDNQSSDSSMLLVLCMAGIFCLACVMAWLNLPERIQIENDDRPKMDIAPNPGAEFLDQIDYRGKIPPEFICPITFCIMHDPVHIEGGHESHVFERSALEKWMSEGNRINPLTRELLPGSIKLIPAREVAQQINKWLYELRESRLRSTVRL